MSDTEPSGRALPWTEEAKVQFLLRIIAQYRADGKAISWSKIHMPGRTTKGLQNMWTKINKTIDELEQQAGGSTPATPVKKATPRKRASKKTADADVDDDEEAEETPKKATPRKRASPGGASKRSKKVKKSEETVKDEDSSVKDEDDDDN